MIKILLVLCFFCFLSTSIYASQEEDYQSCVAALTEDDKPKNNSPVYKKFIEKTCDCLVSQATDKKTDSDTASRICVFGGMIHVVTDDLNKNATGSDIMNACKSMLDINNDEASATNLKLVTDLCQCAQPKLVALFSQSENMTDKQYDKQINAIAKACSAHMKTE